MFRIPALTKTILIALLVSGCTSLPKLEVGYYLPESYVNPAVTQLISCTPGQGTENGEIENRRLLFAYAVSPNVYHRADPDASHKLDLEEISEVYYNAELKMEFFPDGRLKSIGAKSIGQGAAIVDSVLAVADAVIPLSADSPGHDSACDYIANATGKTDGTGVISLTYSPDAPIAITDANGTVPGLDPSESTEPHYKKLSDLNVLPNLEFKAIKADGTLFSTTEAEHFKDLRVAGIVGGKDRSMTPCTAGAASSERLVLRETSLMRLTLTANDAKVWFGSSIVAEDSCFSVPLVEKALFGTRYLKVTMDGNGLATALEFTSEQGVSASLGALGSSISGATISDAEEAAALDAQSDLIYQRERLLRCEADRATCAP